MIKGQAPELRLGLVCVCNLPMGQAFFLCGMLLLNTRNPWEGTSDNDGDSGGFGLAAAGKSHRRIIFKNVLTDAQNISILIIANKLKEGFWQMELPVKQIAGLLKVLANENRLLILCELMKGPRTVGAIGEKIHGITQSALSQHLALLKAHGILDCKKMGMNVIYSIGDRRVEEVIAVLKIHFCSDEKEKTQ